MPDIKSGITFVAQHAGHRTSESRTVTLSDTFHATMTEAMEEATRRRANPAFKDFLTQVEPSSYGGFRVRSFPVDMVIDQLAEGPAVGAFGRMRHLLGA